MELSFIQGLYNCCKIQKKKIKKKKWLKDSFLNDVRSFEFLKKMFLRVFYSVRIQIKKITCIGRFGEIGQPVFKLLAVEHGILFEIFRRKSSYSTID